MVSKFYFWLVIEDGFGIIENTFCSLQRIITWRSRTLKVMKVKSCFSLKFLAKSEGMPHVQVIFNLTYTTQCLIITYQKTENSRPFPLVQLLRSQLLNYVFTTDHNKCLLLKVHKCMFYLVIKSSPNCLTFLSLWNWGVSMILTQSGWTSICPWMLSLKTWQQKTTLALK